MKDHAIAHRHKLIAGLKPNSLVIVRGESLKQRNADCDYPFRQNSTFLYLTDFDEPDAWLAIRTDKDNQATATLFCLPKDAQKEQWTGLRIGTECAKSEYGMQQAFDLNKLNEQMPKLFVGAKRVLFDLDDKITAKQIKAWRLHAARTFKKDFMPDNQTYPSWVKVPIPDKYINLKPKLDKLRQIKDDWELEQIRAAVNISSYAHTELMHEAKSAVAESDLAAHFEHIARANGANGLAYTSIVASGRNGCILHYSQNNAPLADSELILIDAGAECNGYAADITRTFPKGGKFSGPQKAIYELVLKAQLAGIEQVKPESSFKAVSEAVTNTLIEGMIELGLIKGTLVEALQTQNYKRFYPHSFGHWMGLDVHDAGRYYDNNTVTQYVPGMVTTVEPGIYIKADDETVAPQWRGIAVRIEDDILVTANGHEVLSKGCPKTVEDIEKLMAERPKNGMMAHFNQTLRACERLTDANASKIREAKLLGTNTVLNL